MESKRKKQRGKKGKKRKKDERVEAGLIENVGMREGRVRSIVIPLKTYC